MISKVQSSSPHLLPDRISSKTRDGLVSMLPHLPFGKAEQDDDLVRGRERDELKDDVDHHDKSTLPLPLDFQPTSYTVIIGKGRVSKENLGNKRLRVLASNFLTQYAEADDKRTKTRVVNEIIESIRCAGGSFVKKEKNGGWYQVTDQSIREKIGYVFRDLLSDKYRSSSKSKAARRHKEQVGIASLKLQRAMERTYPTLPEMVSSLFSFDTTTPEDQEEQQQQQHSSSTKVKRPSFLLFPTTDLCRMVSNEAEETLSSYNRLQDNMDYDADELMASPLIFPDE